MSLTEEEKINNLLSLSTDDKKKVKVTIDAVINQLQEIDDIRESVKDLVKALATEINQKPADLMTAAKTKYKNKREEAREKANLIDNILDIVD